MELLLDIWLIHLLLALIEICQDILNLLVFLSLFSGFAFFVGTRLSLISRLNLLDIQLLKL